ncbi:MAG: hypothetical protein HY882_04370 [Deltaproteobacteria bacterium]|nr:hypothetical protein [Deltaproteobacteria bacterium]
MKGNEKKFLRCPLCGNIFAKDTLGCPKGCLWKKKTCGLICCPRCRYQFVEESKVIRLGKKIFGQGGMKKEAER